MVDERRVRRLLQNIDADLGYLRDEARRDRTELREPHRLAGLKYVFVTAIEACLKVAQHLCASEGWGPPASNADAMRLLGHHGVVPEELSQVMARAVRFRNVLVHGYVDVDDERVLGFLDRITDLERFVGDVATWMTRDADGAATAGDPP